MLENSSKKVKSPKRRVWPQECNVLDVKMKPLSKFHMIYSSSFYFRNFMRIFIWWCLIVSACLGDLCNKFGQWVKNVNFILDGNEIKILDIFLL